ncbi:MAG TPA: T9SS type A sorting domain-containing protein [Polyangia bacterium]|jgi:hypothetical protein|nr:T9SS type A sorting domain-containing protein [Polyangia bacterium]
MQRFLLIALIFAATGCPPKSAKTPKDNFDADAKSGPDQKRSGAQILDVNKPHTDEISYQGQDKTDWYRVELHGKPNVLTTKINWDNDASDVRIDVYDEFGQEIAASPVRDKGTKAKKLLTQIDKPGIYFIRVTAPNKTDGTVYTMEAEWDEPPPVVEAPPPPPPPPVEAVEEKPHKHHEPREPREPREKPTGETVQARVVNAYREGNALLLNLDKGSAAGIHVGCTGNILQGAAGEDALDGGEFKIIKVLDANKSVGSATLRSLNKNNRVAITLSK